MKRYADYLKDALAPLAAVATFAAYAAYAVADSALPMLDAVKAMS